MPLRFVLRQRNSSVPLEVEGITPDAVRGKSLPEIEKLEVFEGNVKSKLADFKGGCPFLANEADCPLTVSDSPAASAGPAFQGWAD